MKIGIDYIGVSAGAVIINKKGKYFLAKRGLGARDDIGCWEFPGGSVGFYETREDAIRRIIKEKYNFEIEIKDIVGVYDVIDKDNQDHWLSTTYFCEYLYGDPEIMNKDKCDQIGWFDIDELKTLELSRITKLNLKDVIK